MNCQQAQPLIGPYADGELDAARILEVEGHFQNCPACARELRNLQSLKTTIRNDSLYFTAPASLRQSVRNQLRSQVQTRGEFWNWKWLAAPATVAVMACVAFLLTVTMTRHSAEQRLAEEVVSSHVRSLMANHELDVVSTDQHTVKPWFDGKLDFAPPVKDLAAHEFPLIGGRLDYLNGRAVAALVFQRHKHVINLFIWPANEPDALPTVAPPVRGYNLVHWQRGGMAFWAASDLNEKELQEFADDFDAG